MNRPYPFRADKSRAFPSPAVLESLPFDVYLHNMPIWYRLDNAGKLYPSVSGNRTTTVFRLSAHLSAPVHAGRIQTALNNLMPRFPFFAVHLKRGVFWYSLKKSTRLPLVEQDSKYPCTDYPLLRRGIFPFRVRCRGNLIAVEFSHVLTDGTGALIFLQSLLAEYLHLSGVPRQDCRGLPVPGEAALPEESEDAFKRFGNPLLPPPRTLDKAFHLPLSLEQKGRYRITTGIIPLKPLKEQAGQFGTGINNFLTAVMLYSFEQMLQDMPPDMRRRVTAPIRINVPVNLRKFWPTASTRNFFVSIEPEIDPRLGNWSFEEILENVSCYMNTEMRPRFLAARMGRNLRSEQNILARLAPLGVKNMFLPGLYARYGTNLYTSGLSNLGAVSMPEHLRPYIQRFDFIPAPAMDEKVKASVISWNKHIYMNFGRLVRPAITELYVFRTLVGMGIPVKVESNGP